MVNHLKGKMPSNNFSRLRGSFRQGIQRSYVVLEGSFLDSLEVLPVHGKLLFDKPGFYYRTFAAFSDLNILFQRGTPVAAQSNIQSASKKKNLSVVGAVSRTLSIPSVSGPPFQVCGYHADNLLAGRSRFPLGIGGHKVPMALSGSNALLGRYCLNNLNVKRRQLMVSVDNSNISYICKRFHSGCKISMSLRSKEHSDGFVPYGYFIWRVAKTNSNCDPFMGSEWKSFHISPPASFSVCTAPNVSFHNSVCDDQLTTSADSDDR